MAACNPIPLALKGYRPTNNLLIITRSLVTQAWAASGTTRHHAKY